MTKGARALENGWLSASYLKSAREPKSSSWLSAIYLITSRPLPVKAPTTNWGGGGGVLKVQPAYSFRLNSHSQPAFSCLAASSNSLPSQNNQTSFCLYAKRNLVMLCTQLFKFSSYHGACWGCLVVPILHFVLTLF